MPTTLSSTQLADLVEKAKLHMRMADDDPRFLTDAIAIYHDAGATSTAATVQVTSTTVLLVVTGGANAGTSTLTLADAANDTLSELVAVINALNKGWIATLLGRDSEASTLLQRKAATSAWGSANEQLLKVENNDLIEQVITQTLAALETSINWNHLLSASDSEIYEWPLPCNVLVLNNPRITQISLFAIDTEGGLRAKYSGNDTHARIEVTDTAVITTSRAGATTTTNTHTFAANVTTTALVSAIGAVSGWTATVVNARPLAYLVRQGARTAKDIELTLDVWADFDGDYETDYGAGLIRFYQLLYAARGRVFVASTSGESTMPADLEFVLIDALKRAWNAGETDDTAESEGIGSYHITTGKRIAGEATKFFPDYEDILGRWRRDRP